jgi:hypothetical protein
VRRERAERDGTTVLVHWYVQCWIGWGCFARQLSTGGMCRLTSYAVNSLPLSCSSIAGRSRSASVLAAWMLVHEPKQQSVQDVVDRIRYGR